jgi:hypothetical protein
MTEEKQKCQKCGKHWAVDAGIFTEYECGTRLYQDNVIKQSDRCRISYIAALEAELKECEKWMNHTWDCQDTRQRKLRIRDDAGYLKCYCGLDDFRASRLLSKPAKEGEKNL